MNSSGEKKSRKFVGCGKLIVLAGLLDSREFIRQGGRNEAGWEQLSLAHGLAENGIGRSEPRVEPPTEDYNVDPAQSDCPTTISAAERNVY